MICGPIEDAAVYMFRTFIVSIFTRLYLHVPQPCSKASHIFSLITKAEK